MIFHMMILVWQLLNKVKKRNIFSYYLYNNRQNTKKFFYICTQITKIINDKGK